MNGSLSFNEDVNEINLIEVKPKGWESVVIEYGVAPMGISSHLQMCWRVQNTEHVFTIPLNFLYETTGGDYGPHFKEVLEQFRRDYLEWYKLGFREKWMQNYRRQFDKFIYTF